MIDIQPVSEHKSVLGEGAFWDHQRSVLWSVDIDAHSILRNDFNNFKTEVFDFGEQVSCLAPTKSGDLIVASKSGFQKFYLDSGEREPLIDPEHHLPFSRFNDGTVDRQGRFGQGRCALENHIYKSLGDFIGITTKIVLRACLIYFLL